MMVSPSGITISFGGAEGGDDSRAVVARIVGFPAEGSGLINHEMVVPAGQSVQQLLPEGLYNVQLTLPSGRIIQRNVTINKDSNELCRFADDFPPGAGFSLQESVNRSDGEILANAAVASGNTSSDDYSAALRRVSDMAATDPRHDHLKYIIQPDNASSIGEPTPPQRARLMQGIGSLDQVAGAMPDWALLEPKSQHGDTALWRVPHLQEAPPEPANRQWARIELPNGGFEIASLPLPWFCTDSGDFSPAEVLVDPARTAGTATTVAVKDRRLAGLLAFLDRGQAIAARPLLAELERENLIEETIGDKLRNPLAACAAAYVGLAVYAPNEHERWDAWLGNCMTRFPTIPDAAIVHARRLVLRPTGPSDNARAADALRRAFAAGTPYFSAGVLLLREMSILLSADHADLKALAREAGMLAGRVDASQAFTVLRYAPRQPAVPRSAQSSAKATSTESIFRLTMLPASEGDSLILSYGATSDKLRHIVIDGGRKATWPRLKTELATIAGRGETVELLLLSHIDADHIDGLLELAEDPHLPLTPAAVWYNGFDQLMAMANGSKLKPFGFNAADAYSKTLAAKGWPLNTAFSGHAIYTEAVSEPFAFADLKLTLISPNRAKLDKLRSDWQNALKPAAPPPPIAGRPGLEAFGKRAMPVKLNVETLSEPSVIDKTAPNGSSIAMIAEYRGRRVLLGADAHPDIVLASLAALAGDAGTYKIDLVKVPHHGSRANLTREVVEKIDCDRFAISTNGAVFGHPDPEAISRILKFGQPRPKTLYFNYASDRTTPWNDPKLKSKYLYDCVFPAHEGEKVVVDI